MARILQGKSYKWQLGDTPIGSGDAGEVFAALCMDKPGFNGVVKKPARVATGGTIQRQAGQIAQEAQALLRLDGLPNGKAHPPRLLDEAADFTNGTANYFIVSESAPGEALDTMLAQIRLEEKPFPRRVIITVLDALFDLFARSHRAGVLWNDVKLDHIYWHNPTGGVSVIDWGNALFLDESENDSHPTPPRWEDYRQFVDTLGSFVKRSAPELYADLGWEEFEIVELDLPTISILARRIAYQQEVISLKEMEYRSLIKVVLSEDPELDGLQTIHEYQTVLEKIGAPWPRQDVLDYGRTLLHTLSSENNIQECLGGTSLMFDLFGETLDLPWHLLREIYRQSDLVAHPDLAELVEHILLENWTDTLWCLVGIAADVNHPAWWDQLIPVIRQKAIGLVTPPPYEICRLMQEWITSKNRQERISHRLIKLDRQDWRKTGSDFNESPFDYSLLESLTEETNLPRKLHIQLRESYAAGKKAIRELLQTWVNMNWEELEEKLKQLLAWDPDRWSLLALAEEINAFRLWKIRLYEGPAAGTHAFDFLSAMQETRPCIEKVLGQPPWFLSMMNMLAQINPEVQTKPSLDAVKNWCPWILTVSDALQPAEGGPPDDIEIKQTLLHFVGHLRTWSDIDAGLGVVKKQAPGFHPVCKKLTEGFSHIVSLNFEPEVFTNICTDSFHPALEKACHALTSLMDWRTRLIEGNLDAAGKAVCKPALEDWQIIHHACEITQYWKDNVTPILHVIQSKEAESIGDESKLKDENLLEIVARQEEIRQTWIEVYRGGIHLHWLETLASSIDSVRTLFLNWRNGREQSDDRLERILYHNQLEPIRRISAQMLKLSQHIRLARLRFIELQKDGSVQAYRLDTMASVLSHVEVIESILVQDKSIHQVAKWQAALDRVRDTPSSAEQREVVLSLPGDHPLYTWLVETTF